MSIVSTSYKNGGQKNPGLDPEKSRVSDGDESSTEEN